MRRRTHLVRRDALSAIDFSALRTQLLTSPLLGRSTLGGSFRATRGFAITFTHEGRAELEQRFPPLRAFLTTAITGSDPLVRWPFSSKAAAPNAWYLNVLCVGNGASVGRHVDATLQKPSGVPDATPLRVTVIYLCAPKMTGGDLALFRGANEVDRVTPREGCLLHFDGSLAHSVEAVSGLEGDAFRASLVLEQYHFEPDALARLPRFQLDSRAGFSAYLDSHAAAPVRTFELE